MTDIYLVRHGETTSNRDGLWQGATDSELTATGRAQVGELATRLRSRSFDKILSSDLGRATTTAAALDRPFTADAAWREPDLGAWEGRTFDEVKAMSPEAMAGFFRGDDVKLGGADRLSDVAERLLTAYRALAADIGPAGEALIVTHGLAIAVLTGMLLGTRRPNPLALPGNTGMLHLSTANGGDRLHVHNDTTHLTSPPITHRRSTEVVFIRHGETAGNLEGRWQGQQDGELTENGRAQAKAAVASMPPIDALYTSRLGRAVETAEIIGDGIGLDPEVLPDVEEFGFGEWEGLTREEIRQRDPIDAARVFDDGEDLIRGRTGETWARLTKRVRAAVFAVAARHEGRRVAVVSHGGTTRAFVNSVLDLGYPSLRSLASLRNTATATFGVASQGVRVLEWNIAPHLEG